MKKGVLIKNKKFKNHLILFKKHIEKFIESLNKLEASKKLM